jgi:amino acid transporter
VPPLAHEDYGFRAESTASKVPGAPFAEYIETGSLGRFLGFLACLIQASFTIAGKSWAFNIASASNSTFH